MRDPAIFLTFWGVATLLWVLSATVWKVGRLLNFIAIVGITILTGGVVAMLLFRHR